MSKREAYLGLDVGGTGVKAGVFDRQGRLRGFARRGYQPVETQGGLAEIPMGTVYEAARTAVRRAVGESRARVVACSICSQGQTFVSVDARGRPLHRAIMWYDSRAVREAGRLNRSLAKRQAGEETVPPVPPFATAPKVMWMRTHHPGKMARAKRFLLIPDYFSYRLTGRAVIDLHNATTTGVLLPETGTYSRPALAAAGLAEEELSSVQFPGEPIGRIRPGVARQWSLDQDVQLVTGSNDQLAGALGAGNWHTGIISETTGTCLGMISLVKKVPDPLPSGLFAGPFLIPGYHFVLAFSKTAGLVLDWFRRELCQDETLEKLDRVASRAPIGSNGITVFPHFDGMVSPIPNPATRGVFSGLGLHSSRADIYRAIMESISFSLRENTEHLKRHGIRARFIRSIGGGARSDLWLQMKADITGRRVERPAVTEGAVLGAAMLAAAGKGQFSSTNECARAWYRPGRVFEPDSRSHSLYREPYRRYIELSRTMYG